LNPLSIHVTFTAIVPGAYPGKAKTCKKSHLAISSPDEFLVITPSAFAVAVNKQDQQNVYLFAFTRSDDVDDLALRVDKENVFWLEVGV